MDSLIAAKLTLSSFAILHMFVTYVGSLAALGPCVGTFQVYRKVLIHLKLLSCGGMILFMIASIRKAHVGLLSVRSKYCCSHVTWIALFWVFMSSRLMPPCALGR